MAAWPQYVTLILLLVQFVWHLVRDGAEPKTSDRLASVFASFCVFGVWVGLLYAGGFWAPLVAQ